MNAPATLSMTAVTKRFPGVTALDNVSFELRGGEVHALIGENGAGKSTLMKILSGAQGPDAGRITVDGVPVQISSPAAAARLGIGMIYQELFLAPHLTVGENLFLGREPVRGGLVDFTTLHARAQEELDALGAGLRSRDRVADLGLGAQQMAEIAKALLQRARFLVMDEPTAALSEAETERLFTIIRSLRENGVAVAYISHRLEEVQQIADRVTVLRDGKLVASMPVGETSLDELVRLMVGRDVEVVAPRQSRPGAEVLRVERLSRPPGLREASFSLREGEVLGLAGLVGAGRTELVRALFGADPPRSGEVYLRGRKLSVRSPRSAVRAGVALLTEDRKRHGLALDLPVRANVTLVNLNLALQHGLLNVRQERRVAEELGRKLDLRARSVDQPARSLSGGNQQKVVLAKWLAGEARIFLFDEPTQGIDVAAKTEIYRLIGELVAGGAAVLLVSSYLPEVLALSDRILVMSRGRIAAELSREEATEERIMALAAT